MRRLVLQLQLQLAAIPTAAAARLTLMMLSSTCRWEQHAEQLRKREKGKQ
jgi:hypothetical protein